MLIVAPTIKIRQAFRVLKHKNPVLPSNARMTHVHFQTVTNPMRPVWPIHGENRAFSINLKQQSKTSGAGKRAIQLAGAAFEDSLELD
jgi:hypothetical protein